MYNLRTVQCCLGLIGRVILIVNVFVVPLTQAQATVLVHSPESFSRLLILFLDRRGNGACCAIHQHTNLGDNFVDCRF